MMYLFSYISENELDNTRDRNLLLEFSGSLTFDSQLNKGNI